MVTIWRKGNKILSVGKFSQRLRNDKIWCGFTLKLNQSQGHLYKLARMYSSSQTEVWQRYQHHQANPEMCLYSLKCKIKIKVTICSTCRNYSRITLYISIFCILCTIYRGSYVLYLFHTRFLTTNLELTFYRILCTIYIDSAVYN